MDRKILENYLNNKKYSDYQLEQYEEERAKIMRLKSTRLDEKVQSSMVIHDPIAEKIATLDYKYGIIKEYEKVLEEEEKLIIKTIENLDSDYRNILYLRYVSGKSLTEVAVKIHKDYKYTCKLHGLALLEFEKI